MESNNRKWENVIVIVLIAIIICLLFPIIQSIILNSKLSSTKTSSESVINMAELVYTKASMSQKITFPFVVNFTSDNYTAYAGNDNNIISSDVTFKGRLPESGTIIIYSDGEVAVNNLIYDDIVCNQIKGKNIECFQNS